MWRAWNALAAEAELTGGLQHGHAQVAQVAVRSGCRIRVAAKAAQDVEECHRGPGNARWMLTQISQQNYAWE